MIPSDPATGMMARPAPRTAWVLGGLGLFLLPAWAPAHSPEPAPAAAGARVDGSAPGRSGEDAPAGREERPAPGPDGPSADRADGQGVPISQPLVREVSDHADFTGRLEAAQTVEIRARVGGILTEVRTRAGQPVEKGEVLFEVDPRPYKAEMQRAEAEVRRAEARLKRHSAASQRAGALQEKGTMTREEVLTIEGERDEAEASLQSARATRELAALRLESTRITAPIRGKVGRPPLSEGNLVVADTTVLATLTSPDPLYVAFGLDQATALKLARERRGDPARPALGAGLPALVGLADEEGFPRHAQVDSVETRFDPVSGTLRCRAIVPNPDGLLMPGLFARVRLVTGAPKKALLVWERAVLTDAGGRHLIVVNDRNIAERREVKVGGLYDGLRAVKEGLKEGEWVFVGGSAALNAGTRILPRRVAMPTRSPTSP